jgi:hypothetical protein
MIRSAYHSFMAGLYLGIAKKASERYLRTGSLGDLFTALVLDGKAQEHEMALFARGGFSPEEVEEIVS